jgi:LuxR family maltose regulon positive regulatory protein
MAYAIDDEDDIHEHLTAREIEVLHHLPSALSLREVAREMCMSPNTMKTHTRHLYRKLHVGSRSEAVARGRALALFD